MVCKECAVKLHMLRAILILVDFFSEVEAIYVVYRYLIVFCSISMFIRCVHSSNKHSTLQTYCQSHFIHA